MIYKKETYNINDMKNMTLDEVSKSVENKEIKESPNISQTNLQDSSFQQSDPASIQRLMDQLQLTQSSSHTTSELKDSISKHAAELKDAFRNSVLGIGEDDHLEQFNDYTFENSTLNWYLWLALYNESWIFRRVIDKPSQDMVRPGISLLGTADFTPVYKQLSSFKPDLIDALKWSKLFGGSVMVLLFKGVSFEDMEKPIDWNKIKGCRYIKSYVTDRWFGCSPSYDDTVSNLANDDFGKPKYYDIQFADGTTHRIHHSWILRFEGRDAPQLIKTGQLQGWGYAEGAHLLHELSRDEKLKTSIQSLVDKSLIEVIKMKGMTGIFMGADKGNEEQLRKRLEMVNWGRNFNSLTFLDKDDDYVQHQFSGISGLSDLLQQNMWQIAAACEMQGVLFGDLSNGFSSDDDALERYDEKILNDNDTYFRKPLTKLLNILYHVYDIRDNNDKLIVPDFTFNSIISEKKNTRKLNEFNSLLELCNKLIDSKMMTPEGAANALQEYLDTGSINFQIVKPQLALKKAVKESSEKEDFNNSRLNLNGGMDEDTGDLSLGSNDLSFRKQSPHTPSNGSSENTETNNAPQQTVVNTEVE